VISMVWPIRQTTHRRLSGPKCVIFTGLGIVSGLGNEETIFDHQLDLCAGP